MTRTKKKLQRIVEEQLVNYEEDVFFGEELENIHNRLNSLYSSIVAVGQFSVGKSALLNALLGDEILATRRIESTKVLTRIRYCAPPHDPSIVLQFQNGSSKEIPISDLSDLKKYTTFQGEDITNELSFVDVFWPLSILDEQLFLIDTPGANSLTSTAFQVTEQALSEASAVIYLFNGQKGIDQTDYELLKSLIKKQKRIFLVATHVDDLTSDEWQLVKSSVQQKLDEHVQGLENIKIYPVSSIKALQGKQLKDPDLFEASNLGELEADLFSYMDKREYEAATLKSISYDLDILLNEIAAAEAEQQTLDSQAEYERKQRLDRLVAITRQQYQEVLLQGEKLLKERSRRIESQLDYFDEPIKGLKSEMKKRIQNEFKEFRKSIQEKMHSLLLDFTPLEQEFIQYERQAEKSYQGWEERVHNISIDFQRSIIQTMSHDDDTFVEMLEKMNTDVPINWKEFKQKLLPLKIKSVDLDLEQSPLGSYQEELNRIDRKYMGVQRKSKQIEKQEKEVDTYFNQEVERIQNEEKTEINQLGKMPEVESYVETKRKFLLFKKKTQHYDDSKQRQWKEDFQYIREKYKGIREASKELRKSTLYQLTTEQEKVSADFEQINEEENQVRQQLLNSIVNTLNNNSAQVLETYRDFEEDLERSWELHKKHYLERCEQHMNQVSKAFQDFVTQAEQEQVATLYVN